MSRNRLVLVLAGGLAVGALVVLWLRTPGSTTPEEPAPPPAVEPRAPPLQADAEGSYVPGYRFSVNRFRFHGFSLRPVAVVTFTRGGVEHPASCLEARISAQAVHLRCHNPQVGTVTIEGNFLTRLATNRLDTPVLSAVVTVRAPSGEILYSARDSFAWNPVE